MAIGVERFGLTARPVQREHQLGAESLAQRVGGDRRLQFADQTDMLAKRQLRLDVVLEGD